LDHDVENSSIGVIIHVSGHPDRALRRILPSS